MNPFVARLDAPGKSRGVVESVVATTNRRGGRQSFFDGGRPTMIVVVLGLMVSVPERYTIA